MKLLLIGVIIVFAVIVITLFPREHMRIVRTVGTRNDADEVSPPGVIMSLPLFDTTFTYWDGVKETSCEDCPNMYMCPQCPQYGSGPAGYTQIAGLEHMTSAELDLELEPTPPGVLDPLWMSSRERLGACKLPLSSSRATKYLSGDNTIGELNARSTTCSEKNQVNQVNQVHTLLYGDTDYTPSVDICARPGTNGYWYKYECS